MAWCSLQHACLTNRDRGFSPSHAACTAGSPNRTRLILFHQPHFVNLLHARCIKGWHLVSNKEALDTRLTCTTHKVNWHTPVWSRVRLTLGSASFSRLFRSLCRCPINLQLTAGPPACITAKQLRQTRWRSTDSADRTYLVDEVSVLARQALAHVSVRFTA